MWCLQFEGIFKKAPKRLQLTLRARWGMRNETDETIYGKLFSPFRRRRLPQVYCSHSGRRLPHEPQEDRRANQLPVA